MTSIEEKLLQRLLNNTFQDPITDCWLWKGSTSEKGYGRARYEGKLYGVHRLSAYLYLKLDLKDKSKQALHSINCPNKNCWNPLHLYVGTNQQNQWDSIMLGTHKTVRRDWTHCSHGHPLDGDNLYIAADGRRRCKICRLENSKRSYNKKQNQQPPTNNQQE